jgi:nucleotide-binding universal stress UspA family protein
MFKHIYVPVDNSDHSNRAIDLAVEIGKAFGSTLTGCHVYAARLHDYRFKQMEYTLPDEYKDETELERQRKIHDSLIAMGLQLISDSYLDVMAAKAAEAGLGFARKMMDGKHYKALIEDCEASDYDLVIMGALGVGAVKDSQLGSVTERFVRRVKRDTLIVRNHDDALRDAQGAIVVCLDGSPQSFNGLKLGLALSRALGRPLQAVAVYDPYLHYAMFNGIVGVLSEKASKIFRFKEQEQLHEEIIDTGLAKIYQSHLEIARKLAAEDGFDLPITLLDGKCFEKILTFARKEASWLLVLGRVGVHSDANEVDLGSNTENLMRLAPCNVLLTGGTFYPPLDVKAEEIISWTEEAEARMERVPPAVKGVARTALLRYAIEQGHTVVTNKVIDEAMAIFMPTRMAEKMQILAEDLAVANLRSEQAATAICSICGYTVKGPNPVAACPVCKATGDSFQVITREMVETIAAQEGGVAEEESLPGVVVKWSAEARDALREVNDAYLRRRAKARVEKYARSKRIPVITCQLALPLIEETVGRDKLGAGWDTLLAKTKFEAAEVPATAAPSAEGAFVWTTEARARLDRVPPGFMRDMTREEIERVAVGMGVTTIDLAVCEEGIGHARETMNEVIAGYVSTKKPR